MGLGPSTKETTLHFYRDPLVERLALDAEVDFAGVMLLGTSDTQEHKELVACRAGAWAEAMRVDGAIISIDSWGNCHIDFTQVMEALGQRRIPLVGMSFVGNQAAFVVQNSYMDTIIDFNKTTEGIESCIVGQNAADAMDAVKAVEILKKKIKKKFSEHEFKVYQTRELRRIIRRVFPVNEVCMGKTHGMDGLNLLVNPDICPAIAQARPEIHSLSLRVIRPGHYHVPVNAVLDFQPLAVKYAGKPGEGVTHMLSGFTVMLTASETDGFQPVNCGAAFGMLDEVVVFEKPGTPALHDWILNVDVTLKDGHGRTREGIRAAHDACDDVLAPLRDALRGLASSQASVKEEVWDVERRGGMRIVLVKLVAGLGCLYDTVFLPSEPGACKNGVSIMDIRNMPIVFSANEMRDGMLHSLT